MLQSVKNGHNSEMICFKVSLFHHNVTNYILQKEERLMYLSRLKNSTLMMKSSKSMKMCIPLCRCVLVVVNGSNMSVEGTFDCHFSVCKDNGILLKKSRSFAHTNDILMRMFLKPLNALFNS